MEWLSNLLLDAHSLPHAILIFSLVSAIGLLVGSIRIFGITMGIAGVLFAGLVFGHFGLTVDEHWMHFVREFGLILFVYTIGLQVGPGFFESLRARGLSLSLMATSIVLMGVGITIGISFLANVDMSVAVGLFSGGTTNTPSLGAAQQALADVLGADSGKSANPGLGYAVAYPFGVLGTILSIILIRVLFGINAQKEADQFNQENRRQTPGLQGQSIIIKNENLHNSKIADIPAIRDIQIRISRLLRDGQLKVVKDDVSLQLDDVVYVVGTEASLEEFRLFAGQRYDGPDLIDLSEQAEQRDILLTNNKLLGKALDDIDLMGRYGVRITQITRAGVEFIPSINVHVQFADLLRVVGPKDILDQIEKELGNSQEALQHPAILPIFIGLALGALLGSIPWQIPGVPAPVKLGLAGGPLLVAIFLSRLGQIGPISCYLPKASNLALREIGIILFLATVGLKSGDKFVETLVEGEGLYWMLLATLITFVPLMIVGFIARKFFKTNYMSICGLLAGSMTDPPALAFANTVAPNAGTAPSISYATVFPLVTLLRVLSAQLLVLFFVN